MTKNLLFLLYLVTISALQACTQTHEKDSNAESVQSNDAHQIITEAVEDSTSKKDPSTLKNYRSVHVFVALCDNENQGIVPVPKSIGNGKDYNRNLYWGCGYGVRTYLKKSENWQFIKKIPTEDHAFILERLLFKHKDSAVYLLADAYDGAAIQPCNEDMLAALSGKNKELVVHQDSLWFGGASDLVAYIGHNGLMDFTLEKSYPATDTVQRDAIVLACVSSSYYGSHIRKAGAYPLVVTTGFMAPEAYSLEWALRGWVKRETPKQIEERASQAYNHYQKCGIRGARNLMKSGW